MSALNRAKGVCLTTSTAVAGVRYTAYRRVLQQRTACSDFQMLPGTSCVLPALNHHLHSTCMLRRIAPLTHSVCDHIHRSAHARVAAPSHHPDRPPSCDAQHITHSPPGFHTAGDRTVRRFALCLRRAGHVQWWSSVQSVKRVCILRHMHSITGTLVMTPEAPETPRCQKEKRTIHHLKHCHCPVAPIRLPACADTISVQSGFVSCTLLDTAQMPRLYPERYMSTNKGSLRTGRTERIPRRLHLSGNSVHCE